MVDKSQHFYFVFRLWTFLIRFIFFLSRLSSVFPFSLSLHFCSMFPTLLLISLGISGEYPSLPFFFFFHFIMFSILFFISHYLILWYHDITWNFRHSIQWKFTPALVPSLDIYSFSFYCSLSYSSFHITSFYALKDGDRETYSHILDHKMTTRSLMVKVL